MPSLEELKKLENFDLELYNRDPNYRKMVDDSARIKANADQVTRDQSMKPTPTLSVAEQLMQNPGFTKVEEQSSNQKLVEPELIPAKPSDFTFKDFINQEKYDSNSPITKALQGNRNVSVNSMWADRSLLMKYWASKKYFKIKIAGEDRFNEYTFHSVNDDQLKELQQMSEDVTNFYALISFEKQQVETENGVKQPALLRKGRYYTLIADIQSEYRKAVAFLCLGIPEEEFETLEQFSDSDYTVNDIWGIFDLIEGLYQKAKSGGTYFRIAFKL